MEKDWVLIFSTADGFSAEIARGILKENDIDNVVIDKQDRFYHFGEIEIYVHRDNVIKAKYLLNDLEN